MQVDNALKSNLTMEAVVRREFQRSFGTDQVQCASLTHNRTVATSSRRHGPSANGTLLYLLHATVS